MEVICRSLRPADYPAVREIIAESFTEHIHDNPEALRLYDQEPWYDPEHLLVAEADGRVVSQMGVRDSALWCGGVPVPAGLIGTVCTREARRGQGIGAQLVRHSFTWMAERRIPLALLHTGPDRHGFYGRLGLKKTLIEYPRLICNLQNLDLPPTDAHLRSATPADGPALDLLYASSYGRATGAWSRSPDFWERRLRKQPKLWSRLLDFRLAGDAQPLAYLAVEEGDSTATLHEFACLPGAEDLAAALLHQTLSDWRARGFQIADLALSTTHPLRPLADLLAPEDRVGYDVIFIRVQDETAFIDAVTPLLAARSRAVGVRLKIDFPERPNAITIGSGTPLTLALETGDLAALIYNGRRLPGLHAEGAISADPDDADLLVRLFPDTGAFRCSLDGY